MSRLNIRRTALAVSASCVLAAACAAPAFADQASATSSYALSLAPVSASLSEDALDTVVAVYTYGGVAVDVTAREVIEGSTNLESSLLADGTYETPSADSVVTYVRNQILDQMVAENGIEVSDDEVVSYMQTQYGVSDFETLASYYNVTPATAEQIVREAAAVAKLRDAVVGPIGSMPQYPTSPADGDTTAYTADYAAYILNLVGADWDAQSGTWAEGSIYADTMAPYAFDGQSASYEMAYAAYYIAASAYSQAMSAQNVAWQEYANQYLSQVTLTLLTLKV